ncbi:MAG: hypothetical protein IJH71_01780 [Eubacterium sp.]|nr:hypothetical protein [Eubacterium sp.]
MKCINCGRNLGTEFCSSCGFDNKHIGKARNTADYYYNLGLEKAQMRDLFGAEAYLKKALSYNKEHKNARNLLGIVYHEMGEGGKAYIQWKISEKLNPMEDNIASLYVREMEEHPAVFEVINESAKKFNLALSYAKQGSDDLAMIQIKKVLSLTPNFVRGHLLFALLHLRAGDNEAAKNDLNNALAVDQFNTTARHYLQELGQDPSTSVERIRTEDMKPDNDNLKNVKPVDHYEDPSKETWKQFVYMLIGLAIGVIAMFVLVIPSVKAGVSVDYNNLKKEYKQTVNEKDAEISDLKSDKQTLEEENKKLSKSLSIYEGTKGKDSMYDSLLKASKAFYQNDYVECAKYLKKVEKDSLPSKTSKNMYKEMSETAFPNAAQQLFASGKQLFDTYKYEDALKDLNLSYKYEENYETLYYIARCEKTLNKNNNGREHFYKIINESDDAKLVHDSASIGLEMVEEDAKKAAADWAEQQNGGNKEENTETTSQQN